MSTLLAFAMVFLAYCFIALITFQITAPVAQKNSISLTKVAGMSFYWPSFWSKVLKERSGRLELAYFVTTCARIITPFAYLFFAIGLPSALSGNGAIMAWFPGLILALCIAIILLLGRRTEPSSFNPRG